MKNRTQQNSRFADAEVEQAELSLERIANGLGFASTSDTSQLQTNVSLATLRLERLQASLADSQIVAPFAGEIRLFESLIEGKAANAYETVALIVNPESYEITANLVREDMERLAEGMHVSLELPYLTGAAVDGVIKSMPQPFGSGAGTQTVINVVEAADAGLLRAGAGIKVFVDLAQNTDTLWLPPATVRGFGGNRFVVVNQQGIVREVPVEIGLTNSEQTEIISGVSEGMQVLGQ